jgi:hypothetical protein
MFALYDTFNQKVISKHRSVEAAIKADERLQRAVKRANGDNSYLPTDLRLIERGELRELPDESYERLCWLYGDYGHFYIPSEERT